MIDTKRTLINIHKRFPDLSLDDLLAILECIEDYYTGVTWDTNQILGQKIY